MDAIASMIDVLRPAMIGVLVVCSALGIVGACWPSLIIRKSDPFLRRFAARFRNERHHILITRTFGFLLAFESLCGLCALS